MSSPPATPLVGVLPLDKPAGITSADALNRLKRLLPRGTKLGHAGTLDRFATGVLLVLVGQATRECERFMNAGKEYVAEIRLGATTATLDPDSPEEPVAVTSPPGEPFLRETLRRFVGTIEQTPPTFSAVKIGGQRASDRARRGENVTPAARPVRVDVIDLLDFDWPIVRLRIACGRGFYVRSLARDLGAAVGTGGYLRALRRTRVGEWSDAHAVKLDALRTTEDLVAAVRPAFQLR